MLVRHCSALMQRWERAKTKFYYRVRCQEATVREGDALPVGCPWTNPPATAGMVMAGCSGIPGMYIICCWGIDIMPCIKNTHIKPYHSTNSPQLDHRSRHTCVCETGRTPACPGNICGWFISGNCCPTGRQREHMYPHSTHKRLYHVFTGSPIIWGCADKWSNLGLTTWGKHWNNHWTSFLVLFPTLPSIQLWCTVNWTAKKAREKGCK